jgi:Zn-dependent membrane protease YugP
MHWLIILGILLVILLGPQLWVQHVLRQYNRKDEKNFPGSGAEFARHLLQRMGLQEVAVEVTDIGDHYDPETRTVRLTQDKFDRRTLTAITVAAHEVGHAIQHARKEPSFMWRSRLVIWATAASKMGSFLLFLIPVLPLLTRVPFTGLIPAVAAFLILGSGIMVQLLTLPVEIDASFNKALPLLEAGFLDEKQMRPARAVLRAAAWTYVAGALISLLNFWRWMQVLKR